MIWQLIIRITGHKTHTKVTSHGDIEIYDSRLVIDYCFVSSAGEQQRVPFHGDS